MGDCIGQYYELFKGDIRSLDHSLDVTARKCYVLQLDCAARCIRSKHRVA